MNSLRLALLTALFILHPSSFLLGQGSLTPPGAPAPTMKTLDQLEARTPISSVPFTINAAGSYYLTGNLAVTSGGAITISVDDVTLDLNGFTISSTASPASGTGILFPSGSKANVTIRNGQIRGTTTFAGGTFTTGGFQHGVRVITAGSNVRVADLRVFGVSLTGINLPAGPHTYAVERCTVEVCGTVGIAASRVRASSALTCGTDGIVADAVRDSFGESVGTVAGSDGIQAGIVINSTGVAVAGVGIVADTAAHCDGTSTTGASGMNVTGAASFCNGKRDGGVAITAGIAIGCGVTGNGTVSSPSKHLGTP